MPPDTSGFDDVYIRMLVYIIRTGILPTNYDNSNDSHIHLDKALPQ